MHGPPPVFHPYEARADCLGCHRHARVGARALPRSHEAFPASTCAGCHVRAAPPAVEVYAIGCIALLIGVVGLALALRRARLLGRQRLTPSVNP